MSNSFVVFKTVHTGTAILILLPEPSEVNDGGKARWKPESHSGVRVYRQEQGVEHGPLGSRADLDHQSELLWRLTERQRATEISTRIHNTREKRAEWISLLY